MGTDTRILIRRKSLLSMDFYDFKILYDQFGRWHYFIEHFDLEEENIRKITIDEVLKHMASSDKITKKYRDFIIRFSKYDIIFLADSVEFEDEEYISLWDIKEKCEEAIRSCGSL